MAKILSLMDKFRHRHAQLTTPQHVALCKVLESPMLFDGGDVLQTTVVADWIMRSLWAEGFEIVPREPDEAS